MLRIPWSTDIGLAHAQICVTLISLIAWSRSPTISAAKRLGGQRSQGISLPSWKLSHLFYIWALAFIFSKTRGPVHSLMVSARGTNAGPGEEFSSCRCYSPGNDFELSSQMNPLWKKKLGSVLEMWAMFIPSQITHWQETCIEKLASFITRQDIVVTVMVTKSLSN